MLSQYLYLAKEKINKPNTSIIPQKVQSMNNN